MNENYQLSPKLRTPYSSASPRYDPYDPRSPIILRQRLFNEVLTDPSVSGTQCKEAKSISCAPRCIPSKRSHHYENLQYSPINQHRGLKGWVLRLFKRN